MLNTPGPACNISACPQKHSLPLSYTNKSVVCTLLQDGNIVDPRAASEAMPISGSNAPKRLDSLLFLLVNSHFFGFRGT